MTRFSIHQRKSIFFADILTTSLDPEDVQEGAKFR